MNLKKKIRKNRTNTLIHSVFFVIRVDTEELKRAKEKISELSFKVQSLEVNNWIISSHRPHGSLP